MDTSRTPETLSVPRPRARLRAAVSWAVMVLALGACEDSPTDPMVGLVAEEAGGALALGVRLPDPSVWVDPVDLGDDGESGRALDAWRRSWDLPLPEARRLRTAAYPALVRGMVGLASSDVLAEETAALGDAVRRTQALEAALLPPHVAAGLLDASAHHGAAAAALSRGDTQGLLNALIRGGDALREVGPEAVARDMVSQVEAASGRLSPDHSYSEEDLERLRRLIQGGRQAVDNGDWVLAIRRAYYAKGLLTGFDRGPS